MIRLFAALAVPNLLKKQIAALPRKGLDSASFSHNDDLHITLRYVGEVEAEKLSLIEKVLEAVRVKQFSVVVRGLAIFEKQKRTVLHAPVESARSITHLSAEITERLQNLDFVFSEQSYKPHVTIARLKNPQGLDQYIRQNEKKIFVEWKAEEFILYRSAEPDAHGQRYTKLRAYPLHKF